MGETAQALQQEMAGKREACDQLVDTGNAAAAAERTVAQQRRLEDWDHLDPGAGTVVAGGFLAGAHCQQTLDVEVTS